MAPKGRERSMTFTDDNVSTEVMHGQARSTPIRCTDATTERTRGEFCSSEDAHATRIMTTDRRLSQLAARLAL